MDATTPVQQPSTSSTTPTNDPQQSTVANSNGLQPQASSLQNASSQTVDGLKALEASQNSIPLSTVSGTAGTTSTTTVSRSYHVTRNTVLYGGLILLVVIFVVSLFVGLNATTSEPKTAPDEPAELLKSTPVNSKKAKSKKTKKKGNKNGKKK